MGNPVNKMQSTSQLSPEIHPEKVNHWINLAWWLLLVVTVVAVHSLVDVINRKTPDPASRAMAADNIEKEAFVALVFGKVSSTGKNAIATYSFRKQLRALKESGYHSVRLARINQWRKSDDVSLPARPLLLTFEEADRETIDIADNMLARLGMTALVFVNVNELDNANIHRVSWHRLEEMAASGRWEIGISGCPHDEEGSTGFPALTSQQMTRQRVQLEQRLHAHVDSADCSSAWPSGDFDAGSDLWRNLLHEASLKTGFVAAPPGANYRAEPEALFRRIRVSKSWDQVDLLDQVENHAPRRAPFFDTFSSDRLATAWVVDSGETALADGKLRIDNQSGQKGALLLLSGTEQWRDAEAEVQLQGIPVGQFWLSLRYRPGQPFVRLGVAEEQVMLQEIDAKGVVQRQLAAVDAPSGTVRLKLRVIGSRAFGYVNGHPLLTRPASLPKGQHYGALAIAVWDGEGSGNGADAFQASAQLVQIKAAPIIARGALLISRPDATLMSQVQKNSDRLSMLSPDYFAWADGRPQSAEEKNRALEIFARFHHLDLLPALVVDGDTRLENAGKLAAQAIAWANNDAYDGLNLVVPDALANDDGWRVFLRNLAHGFDAAGKTLTVTLLNDVQSVLTHTDKHSLIMVSARPDSLSITPHIFHPVDSDT